MVEIFKQQPELLITNANNQSNCCQQATAAAVKHGIPNVLVMRNADMQEIHRNVLHDLCMNAEVLVVP